MTARSAAALSRAAGHGRPAAPVRHVHLGLGNFFRAHQAVYTERSPEAAEWGIAAFTGRSAALADAMQAQQCLYTLITRAPDGDRFDVIGSVVEAHAAGDHASWLHHLRSPTTALLTLTVTEAAYLRAARCGLDRAHARVLADADALRRDPAAPVTSVPGRLVAGLAARRAAGGAPLSVVPCDNLSDNGAVVARVVTDMAELVDPALAEWMTGAVSFVTSMVDRITPRATGNDESVVRRTGILDRCPVVTEPFTEWVLAGTFPGGRPSWERAGAKFVDDVTPYEQRKLWLLNGAHSLLAYAGSIRGHETVAQAVADDTCLAWIEEFWQDASAQLDQPAAELAAYRAALLERFANPAMRHRLDQIAADGSQKLPLRVLPVLARERAAGRLPLGATRALAAWVLHLRGMGAAVTDARQAELVPLATGRLRDAVRRVVGFVDPRLAADTAVTAAVLAQAEELVRS